MLAAQSPAAGSLIMPPEMFATWFSFAISKTMGGDARGTEDFLSALALRDARWPAN